MNTKYSERALSSERLKAIKSLGCEVAFSYTPRKAEFYVAYATRALVWGDPIG